MHLIELMDILSDSFLYEVSKARRGNSSGSVFHISDEERDELLR